MSATFQKFQPYEIVKGELAAYFGVQAQIEESAATSASDLLPPLAWAEAYRHIDGEPFSLDYKPNAEPPSGYEPLKEIYNDDHPFIVIMKPAQVGVSELAINRALHALDVGSRYWNTSNDGLNVGYLFPTQVALYDFSKERLSALKDESDKLDKFFSQYDDVGFKQAGKSYFYIRGAWSVKALKSFKADLLIFDEYDEMLPRAVALAEKRIRHSQVKRQIRLSTPTYPGKGIHEAYLLSDQREWEVHCSLCDAWSTLDFFRDVRINGHDHQVWKRFSEEEIFRAEILVACPSCHERLLDKDRFGPGRFVARRPEITRIRGYHVPALSFPSVSLVELAIAAISIDAEKILEFYRSDLGLPFEPSDSRVTETMLKQLSAELERGKLPAGPFTKATMGVDPGKLFHFRISGTGPDNRRYVLAMGSVEGDDVKSVWEKLDDLMEQYKVRHVVMDAGPELHGAEAWSNKHKGKVLRAYYQRLKGLLFKLPSAEDKEMRGIKVKIPKKLRKDIIHIDRTMAMDTVYNIIANGDEIWPQEIHDDAEVLSHMTAPIRVITEDQDGQPVAEWVHTKRDDLYHACVYDLIALKTLPQKMPGVLAQGSAKIPM